MTRDETLSLLGKINQFNHGGGDAIVAQPDPILNQSTPIWELVIKDMKQRDQVGRERYGVPLQSFNGRDTLTDAYQEALDLAVYIRSEIEERKVLEAKLSKAMYALELISECGDIDEAIQISLRAIDQH